MLCFMNNDIISDSSNGMDSLQIGANSLTIDDNNSLTCGPTFSDPMFRVGIRYSVLNVLPEWQLAPVQISKNGVMDVYLPNLSFWEVIIYVSPTYHSGNGTYFIKVGMHAIHGDHVNIVDEYRMISSDTLHSIDGYNNAANTKFFFTEYSSDEYAHEFKLIVAMYQKTPLDNEFTFVRRFPIRINLIMTA